MTAANWIIPIASAIIAIVGSLLSGRKHAPGSTAALINANSAWVAEVMADNAALRTQLAALQARVEHLESIEDQLTLYRQTFGPLP